MKDVCEKPRKPDFWKVIFLYLEAILERPDMKKFKGID